MQPPHHAKALQYENKNRLLSELQRNKELTSSQLEKNLGWNSVTLSSHLAKAKKAGLIDFRLDAKDARSRIYFIKPESQEQVKAYVGRYEAVKFILDMKNPDYAFEEKNGKGIAIFTSGRSVNESGLKMLAKMLVHFNAPQFPGMKTAIVIMVKGKERREVVT